MVAGKPWETSLGVPATAICAFGAFKGLPPMLGRKPFESSEGKKAGRKGGKFKFPALPPCLWSFQKASSDIGGSLLKPLKPPIVAVGTPREVSQGLHATMGDLPGGPRHRDRCLQKFQRASPTLEEAL